MMKAEAKVFGEAIGIPFDGFVKTECFDAVEPGEMCIEYHASFAQRNHETFHVWYGCWLGHGVSEQG